MATWFQNHRHDSVKKASAPVLSKGLQGKNWKTLWAQEHKEEVKTMQQTLGDNFDNIGGWKKAVALCADALPENKKTEWTKKFQDYTSSLPGPEEQAK